MSRKGIGLVLSGGGAKGAYQVGVWSVLVELGLADRIQAISGTSIGAINAAAFAAVRDPARIEAFWRERIKDAVTKRHLRSLSPAQLNALASEALRGFATGSGFPFPGLLDRTGLEAALRELLPDEWPADAPAVYATALESVGGPWPAGTLKRRVFRLDTEPDADRRRLEILASSAIPFGLDPVEIDGAAYVDGGWESMGGDNTPAAPILENHPGIRTLVVVHLNAASMVRSPWKRPALADRVRYIEIRPSEPLPGPFDEAARMVEHLDDTALVAQLLRRAGGVLAFDPDWAMRSMALGRDDAQRMFG